MELESVVCKFVHNSNHRQIISNRHHKQLELAQECNFKRKHYYQHRNSNLDHKQLVLEELELGYKFRHNFSRRQIISSHHRKLQG